MTTLRAAPTRHRHTENLSGERRRYLPKQRPKRREGWGQKTTITTACKSNESKMIDSLIVGKAPEEAEGGRKRS